MYYQFIMTAQTHSVSVGKQTPLATESKSEMKAILKTCFTSIG